MFKNITNWLSNKPRHVIGTRALQICIGCSLLFRVSTEIPFARYLWGVDGIGYGSTQWIFGKTVGFYLDQLYTSMIGVYFILSMLTLGSVFLVFNVKTRLASLLMLFGVFILEQRLPDINDGGDNITRLILIYSLLLASNTKILYSGRLKTWIHNVGVIAIKFQIIIMYFTSGFMKATGEKWYNGTAMYHISNVEWFSLPGFRDLFLNPIVTTIGSYIPMIFMLMFPIAIFSRLKLFWIFIGILLHLSIMFFMGLITFSTVMIGMELFIINDKEYKIIKSYYNHILTKVKYLSLKLTSIVK